MDERPEDAVATIKLRAPANCGPFERFGVTYTPDEAGNVDVPGELVNDLHIHGFTVAPPPAQARQPLLKNEDDDDDFVPDENIETMGRAELFAYLKAAGVKAVPPITIADLRTKARDASIAAQAAEAARVKAEEQAKIDADTEEAEKAAEAEAKAKAEAEAEAAGNKTE